MLSISFAYLLFVQNCQKIIQAEQVDIKNEKTAEVKNPPISKPTKHKI